MSTLQRDYLDLQQGGDTGQDNVDAIQPVEDGEGATQTTLRRPSENLRGRTEAIRDVTQDLLYYRDFNHLVIEGATGHTITWAGVSTGLVTQTGDLTIRPLLTPASSTKAQIAIGATPGTDEMIYDVAAGAYATHGMNAVSIEHRDGGAGQTHQVTITDGPVKRILVQFDSADSSHDTAATKILFDAAVAADPDLVGLITSTDNGAASNVITAQSETFFEGTADQEAHRIPSGTLTSFTTTTPLTEGDAIGVWYRYLREPGGGSGDPLDPKGVAFGGRWESNPDRSTETILSASLFITSEDPQKIPGAVPLCKVVNDELVFFDGSRYVAGATGPVGTTSSLYIDDSGFSGSKTLTGGGGIATPLSPPTAQEAFEDVDTKLVRMRAHTYICTDGSTSTGGDYSGTSAVSDAVTAAGGSGATIFVRRGTYTIPASFTMGDNVMIIGEDPALVTLDHSAGTDWTMGVNSHIWNCEISTVLAGIDVAASDNYGSFRNVTITEGTLDIQGDHWTLDTVRITSSTLGNATGLTLGGDYNTVRNLFCTMLIGVTGDHNVLDTVEIDPNASFLNLITDITGDHNTYRDFKIRGYTATPFGTVGLFSVSGAYNLIENGSIDQTGSPLDNDDSLIQLRGATYTTFRNVNAETDNGRLINIIDTSGANQQVVFDNCRFFSNSSAMGTSDYVVGVDSGGENDHEITWNNCVFDQNEQTAYPMFDLKTDATSLQKWAFNDCKFYAALFVAGSVQCGTFTDATFSRCYFAVKNPIDGGLSVRLLPGDNAGYTGQFWVFDVSTAGGGCNLHDCIFDMWDSEVEIVPAGDPDIDTLSTGYILTLNGDNSDDRRTHAKDIRIINVNRHFNNNQGSHFHSIVSLSYATLDGLQIDWTATAASQGGTADWTTIVALNGSYSRLYRWLARDGHPTPAGTEPYYITHGGLPGMVVADCHIEGDCFRYIRSNGGDGSIVRNNIFGSSADGQTSWVQFSGGDDQQYVNNTWYVNRADYPARISGTTNHMSITNNVIINVTASDGSSVPSIDVTSATINELRLNGNHIEAPDTGANTRELFGSGASGSPTVVAVGNVFLNPGGSGMQSTNIVPDTDNIGL